MTFLNYFYRLLHRDRIFVNDVLSYVKKKANPVILEAGAADGSDTFRFSKLMPNSVIYAFEPVKQNYNILLKTVEKQKNIRTFNMALSDFDGVTLMNVSHNVDSTDNVASSSSILNPKLHIDIYPQITFNQKEKVIVKKIDTWALENNVDHVDVMWLDMQGAEFKTLKASPEIMKTVKVLYTEVNFVETYEECGLYEEYRDWLVSQGFILKKKEFRWKEQGNALFVRE